VDSRILYEKNVSKKREKNVFKKEHVLKMYIFFIKIGCLKKLVIFYVK